MRISRSGPQVHFLILTTQQRGVGLTIPWSRVGWRLAGLSPSHVWCLGSGRGGVTDKHHKLAFSMLPPNPGSPKANPACELRRRRGGSKLSPRCGRVGGPKCGRDEAELHEGVLTPVPGCSCPRCPPGPGLAASAHVPWWQVAFPESSLAAGLEKQREPAERRGVAGRGRDRWQCPHPAPEAAFLILAREPAGTPRTASAFCHSENPEPICGVLKVVKPEAAGGAPVSTRRC